MNKKQNKAILYQVGDSWSWKYDDDLCIIPVYGRFSNTKEEAVIDFKRFANEINVTEYIIEETLNDFTNN